MDSHFIILLLIRARLVKNQKTRLKKREFKKKEGCYLKMLEELVKTVQRISLVNIRGGKKWPDN